MEQKTGVFKEISVGVFVATKTGFSYSQNMVFSFQVFFEAKPKRCTALSNENSSTR